MSTNRGEDKPLLVSILDSGVCGSKGSDDEAYIDTKYGQSSSMIRRWKYGTKNGGNGRAKSMIMGAADIIQKWPDHMTMCWLIAVAFCMIIITCIFMLESSVNPTVPQSFSALSIQKKCLAQHDAIMKNAPQQYPEKTNIYLHIILNGKQTFNTKKHKTLLTSVIQHHPNHLLNVYVLYNDTNEMNYKRNTRFKDWELYHNTYDAPKFFETSSSEDEQNAIIPFHAQRDDAGDLVDFENINIIRSSLSSYFLHSPLRFRWRILPDSMIPFVLRVLSLWEHGGITMPWQLFRDKTDIYCANKDVTGQFQDLVKGFKKIDLFAENIPTTRMTKQQIVEEIQSFVDIGGGLTIESEPKLTNSVIEERLKKINLNDTVPNLTNVVVEEQMRHFNLNDTEVLEPTKAPKKVFSDLKKRLIAKADARAMAKLLKAQRPQDYHSKSKDADDESSSSSSSSSGDLKKMQKNLLTNDKASKDLSSTERQIRKMLKNPHLRKKLSKVNIEKAMGKDSILKRVRRELEPLPPVNILSPPNIDALDLNKNLDYRLKAVRRLPSDQPRYDEHSSRSGSSDDSSEFDSSEYYSSSSYSGFKALKPFKADFGRVKPKSKGLEWHASSSSMYKRVLKTSKDPKSSSSSSESSMKTIGGISSSVSDSSMSRTTKNYFKEKKAYVNHKVFETMNIFTMPRKMNITADRFGYYFSTKKPCHAFLGEIISILQSSNELKNADHVIEKGLKVFCRGHKYTECMGISLI